MTEPAETSEPVRSVASSRRLWLVFGVAGLLIVITGGVLLWSFWHQQTRIANEIERLGGICWAEPGEPTWLRNHLGSDVIVGYDRVGCVDFSFTDVSDSDLTCLKTLPNLPDLRLIDTQISDAGLMHLQYLTELQYLSLQDTEVTDAGLVHLKGLTNLSRLILVDTRVTDAGVKGLQAELPKCRIIQYPDLSPEFWKIE